jgi:thiol-disulfide isomerase/thioredoxin
MKSAETSRVLLALGFAASLGLSGSLLAADQPNQPKIEVLEKITIAPSPDQASWAALLKATQLPSPPKEWNQVRPSKEEIAAFEKSQALALEKNVGLVRSFVTGNPTHPKLADAKLLELRFSIGAVQGGREALKDRTVKLIDERIAIPSVNDQERFQLEMIKIELGVPAEDREDAAKIAPVMVKAVKGLRVKYPGNEMPNQFLLMLAGNLEDETQIREIAKDVIASTKEEKLRAEAEEMIKRFERIGKPLDIQFTAVDGRKINLADMKGKVVLIDFWATWCGPCMAELPNVKAAYSRLHPKGFEIVGISFDQEKDALQKTLKKEGMTWPQYFDGEGWGNKFGETFGIKAVPSMWLVDKKGNLRDISARTGLEAKVEKLLAEK